MPPGNRRPGAIWSPRAFSVGVLIGAGLLSMLTLWL